MKKFFISILACVLAFSFSGETIYLDDFSQYQDVINGMDYQADYKEKYEEMISKYINEVENSERMNMSRAKVLEASDVKVDYGQYSPYYSDSYYKNSYQMLDIEVLDGEFAGEKVEDVQYILTCDTFENIKLGDIKSGDIINVYVVELEDGSLYAASTTYDSPVVRWQIPVVLFIIAVLVVAIYTGKHSAKFLVPLVLLIDLLFIVAVPAICDGINIMFLVTIITVLSTILISVLKFGIKAETFVVILSTSIITLVLSFMVYGVDSLANMTGITYDSAYVMETMLPRFVDDEVVPTVNFHDLSATLTILVMFFGILTIACKTVETYTKKEKNNNIIKETISGMQENLAESLVLAISLLLVNFMPKIMLFIVKKSSFNEYINSEILITEIFRILFLVIGMAITVPVTAALARVMDEEF